MHSQIMESLNSVSLCGTWLASKQTIRACFVLICYALKDVNGVLNATFMFATGKNKNNNIPTKFNTYGAAGQRPSSAGDRRIPWMNNNGTAKLSLACMLFLDHWCSSHSVQYFTAICTLQGSTKTDGASQPPGCNPAY